MNGLKAILIAAASTAAAYLALDLYRLASERWGAAAEIRARALFDEMMRRAAFEDEVKRAMPHVNFEVWQALHEGQTP